MTLYCLHVDLRREGEGAGPSVLRGFYPEGAASHWEGVAVALNGQVGAPAS